jgi:cleavage and polyadenylation specificity factor subunit 5
LKPGEDEIEGLKLRLHQQLSPQGQYDANEWEIGELISVWWRPNYETFMASCQRISLTSKRFLTLDNAILKQYPYVPAHITKPKEQKKLFIIHLPERSWSRFSPFAFDR